MFNTLLLSHTLLFAALSVSHISILSTEICYQNETIIQLPIKDEIIFIGSCVSTGICFISTIILSFTIYYGCKRTSFMFYLITLFSLMLAKSVFIIKCFNAWMSVQVILEFAIGYTAQFLLYSTISW
jgi:hypothetical protein